MTATGGARDAYPLWQDVPHEDWCPAKPPVNCECCQDCGCMRRLVLDARSWARHGYEIGQRSCTWSDHGVAPKWLIEEHDHASFATTASAEGGESRG